MNLNLADRLVCMLFPRICGLCGKSVESLTLGAACLACWDATRLFTGDEALCPKCGRFLADGRPTVRRCGRCSGHHYDSASACGLYEGALAMSVIRCKSEAHLPSFLRGLLRETLVRSGMADADLLIPVPLSKRRRIERGFNQAEIFATSLGMESGIGIDAKSLIRRFDTPLHRAAMDERARTATVKGVFDVVRPRLLNGRHLILVDDVMTSGATASSCAEALKEAGAASVRVLTLARAR